MKRKKQGSSNIHELIEERFGQRVSLPEVGPGIDTLAGLLSHRSHRAYREDPVDEDLLMVLIACALSSPSKSDLQQADIVRVRDRQKRRAVSELIPSMPWVEDAPEFLIFCGNGRRIRQLSELRGRKFANDHLDAFFNAAVDAAIVLATFINAAEAVGLGCCPISAVRNHCEALNELFGLPELVFPIAGMCLGYPQSEVRLSHRLPLDVTVHTDVFDEKGLEQRIEAYDRRRAAAMPESERYLWSEAKAKQYSEPQRTGFGAYIRGKGFSLS